MFTINMTMVSGHILYYEYNDYLKMIFLFVTKLVVLISGFYFFYFFSLHFKIHFEIHFIHLYTTTATTTTTE